MLPLDNAAVAAQIGGGCLMGSSLPRELVPIGAAKTVVTVVSRPCTDSRSKSTGGGVAMIGGDDG